MRRLLALLPLLACVAAAGEPEWVFRFANGDSVRGRLGSIRNGRVHLIVPAATRSVAVPLTGIERAEPGAAADQPAQVLRLANGGALLGQCRGIERGRVSFAVEALGVLVVPPDEVTELLPAAEAVRAYHRSVSEQSSDREPPPAPERHHALWIELGRDDANRAFEAHRELVRAGPDAVAMLAERLRVAPDSPEVIRRLIQALDDDAPEVRLDAHRRLASLGEAAGPVLSAAARGDVSPEARHRIAALLAELEREDAGAKRAPDRDVRHFLRAIRVLEEIGTPAARAVLEGLANGPDEAPTAREARLALERLRRLR